VSRVCYHCGRDVGTVERVGRRDACLACGRDLHCCRNCRFHDPAFNNQCREPQAERQVDKEAGNFCDYFGFAEAARPAATAALSGRAALDALFATRKRP
jgi:hypothetical protein